MSGGDSSALIQLGFVGAPYGVRGWIKLRSHTDPPERLLEHRSLQIGREGAWRTFRIEATGRSDGPNLAAFVHVPLIARGAQRSGATHRVTLEELVDAGEAMLLEMVKLTRRARLPARPLIRPANG